MRLALAGDAMLGRGVGERLAEAAPETLVAPGVVDAVHEADAFILNLECCISSRGSPWPAPRKPFFFRAPPSARALLTHLGVTCVTLANNHALDFGEVALADTLDLLADAGIGTVGAGRDIEEARRPAELEIGPEHLRVVAFADHPEDYAAGSTRPGVAFADLRRSPIPSWVATAVEGATDVVLVTPHWGPNMVAEPVPHVRAAAAALVEAGTTVVAGHSAHVFHGVAPPVLFDLGGFLDDYAVDPVLRNDLGLLFLVDVDAGGIARIEGVPLALDHCRTRLASGDEARWIERRFRAACATFGTEPTIERGRLVIADAVSPSI